VYEHIHIDLLWFQTRPFRDARLEEQSVAVFATIVAANIVEVKFEPLISLCWKYKPIVLEQLERRL
jgi:hypothetical protein